MVDKEDIEKIFSNLLNPYTVKCSPKSDAMDSYDVNDYPISGDNDSIDDSWVNQDMYQMNNVDYTRQEANYVHYYGKNTYDVLNNMLWDTDKWKKGVERGLYDDQEWYDEMVNGLDSVISKSVIQENTTVFRGGQLPKGLKVGDHSVLKGYTSTSYNPNRAREFQGVSDGRYNITIRVPKGAHGVLFNDQFDTFTESELLIGRNQKFVVLNIDDSKMEAEILLYD